MEFLAVINFIGLIYVIVQLNSLRSRISNPKAIPQEPQNNPMPVPVYKTLPQNMPVSGHEDPLERFGKWFARDWPLKVGAIFILLGFVWFLSYAFLHNWIGQTGRIVLGIVVGSMVLMWGALRIQKNAYQGEIITALGSGIVLFSVFSAQYIYHQMFPPIAALALVLCVSLAVAFISHSTNNFRLAVLGFIIASSAPLFTASESRDLVGLFSYLFFVVIGYIWLVRLHGWRSITVLAILAVWFYIAMNMTVYLSPSELVTIRFFSITFTMLFYFLSIGGYLYDRTKQPYDAVVGVLSGLYAIHWIFEIIPTHNQSLILVVLAVAFMAGAQAVFRIHAERYPVSLYTLVSILLLVIATVREFHGSVLPIALAVEALSLVIFADRVYGKNSIRYMAGLYVLPLIGSFGYLFDSYGAPEIVPMLVVNGSLYAASVYLSEFSLNGREESKSAKVILTTAGVYSLLFFWRVVGYYVGRTDPFFARGIVLTVYALCGIGLYIYGLHGQKLWTRRFGFILTMFVIVRLLLVEVWDMQLGARIITFFMIGAIFMASVFIRKSNHETI